MKRSDLLDAIELLKEDQADLRHWGVSAAGISQTQLAMSLIGHRIICDLDFDRYRTFLMS